MPCWYWGREENLPHFLDQHKELWDFIPEAFSLLQGNTENEFPWHSNTILGCLVVYLPLHYTAVTVIFSICSNCFGERDRKWIQYLLPRHKSILTRTNAFYIPLQLGADLVFMVLFLVQSLCWVSFAKWHTQEERPRAFLPPAKSKFISLAFRLFIIWETWC